MEEKKLYTSLKQYQNRFLRQKAIGNLFFTKNSTTTNRSIIDLYQLLFTNFAEPQQEFQNFLTGSALKLKEINAYSIPNIDLHLKVLYSSEDDKVFMHKYRELSTKSNIFKVKPIFEEIIKFYKRKNKDNPEDLVNKTIKFLNSYFAEQFDNLKIIVKDSENELSEKGNNVFYLGYPYIEGFLETEEVFRGPLLLWPIVVDNNDKVKREMTLRIETTNVIINPMIKLRQLAARKINLDLVNFDPLDDEEDINKIEKALTELSEIGLTFKNNNPTVVSQTSIITNFSLPLKAYNKEQATSELKNKYNFNESAILCAAFIGIYKTTNTALFSDYNKILENTNLGELNDLFFQILNEYEDSKEKRIEFEKSFREQDVIAISELDFYQKLAIKKAMNSNLIIEGPPGTGKSQTITNLIVNDIYRGDNVLLCAEKKTALEVVYNNMKKFQKYCLFIDDMNNKSFVFSQIKAAIDSSLNTVVSEKQKISNDEMDYYFDKIREYRQLIEEEKTQNYTLYKNDLKDINNYLDPNYYERLNQYAIFSLALESFTEGVEKIYANLDDIIKIKEFKQKFAVLIELHYKKINFLKLSKLLTKIKDKKLDYLIYNMLAKGEIKPKINLTKDYDDYVNFLSEASSKITKLKTELESLDEFLAGLVLLKLETNFDPIITDNYPFIDFLLESQLAKDHLIILYKWIYIKNFENNNEDMIGIANSVWHKEIKEIEIKSINVAIDQLDNNLAIDIREKI
ncbi:AAA domain-containing protein [Spiroplasma sp. DGKH1]|uniref:AAA domain-containing protein n=1 Tax=Spiroplasma sp. DGKH1 TaxID=3050074 RepID=UPI0034C68CAD